MTWGELWAMPLWELCGLHLKAGLLVTARTWWLWGTVARATLLYGWHVSRQQGA